MDSILAPHLSQQGKLGALHHLTVTFREGSSTAKGLHLLLKFHVLPVGTQGVYGTYLKGEVDIPLSVILVHTLRSGSTYRCLSYSYLPWGLGRHTNVFHNRTYPEGWFYIPMSFTIVNTLRVGTTYHCLSYSYLPWGWGRHITVILVLTLRVGSTYHCL